jgi:hypothetical protein
VADNIKQYCRKRIRQRDHWPAPPCVKQAPDQQWSEKVADGEGHDVEADAIGADAVEFGEHQGVGEKDRIVEERLRHHQA